VPFALFSQFYRSCSLTLANFSSFPSFGLKDTFSSFPKEKMSQDKRIAAETKLPEEEKLFEEKKSADPYIVGFIESMAK
jgi:hypothetical protein